LPRHDEFNSQLMVFAAVYFLVAEGTILIPITGRGAPGIGSESATGAAQ
jgi:hypothetical protein